MRPQAKPGGRRREAAGKVVRGSWPHYFHGKIIALMETPKHISKRLGEFIINSGFDELDLLY